MQHLRKLISLFYKEHPDKPTATSEAIDIVLPIAKLTISPTTKFIKRKQGRSTKDARKRARRNWVWFL